MYCVCVGGVDEVVFGFLKKKKLFKTECNLKKEVLWTQKT